MLCAKQNVSTHAYCSKHIDRRARTDPGCPMQVTELDALGVPVPYNVPFPDLDDDFVPTAHAIALTGNRIVTSFFRTHAPTLAATLSSRRAAHSSGNVTDLACSPATKRQRTDSACGSCAVAVETTACSEPQHGALAGAQGLAAVMRLEAPVQMSLQGIYDLLEACSVLLAAPVIRRLPMYAHPALVKAPLCEVCLWRLPELDKSAVCSQGSSVYVWLRDVGARLDCKSS